MKSMFTTKTLAGALVTSLLIFTACSSEEKKINTELDKKVESAPALTAKGDMAGAAHAAFKNTPGLTEAQKIKLEEVLTSTFVEAAKIKTEFGKTKGVLFQTLVSPAGSKKEINNLKKRLADLDKKRLDIMFRALDDAEKIIGKNQQTAEYFQRIMSEVSTHGGM